VSALTRCDGCGCERAGRRLKYQVSMRVQQVPGQTEAQAQYVQRDICSDECLANYAQKRIADRAERKAREASTGADVTTLPAGSAERAVS
jgi:hypothetical protein